MKNFKLPIISIIAVMVLSTVNAQQINIIPKPVKLSLSVDGEVHELPARVMVYYFNAEAALLGEYLVGELSGLQGVKDVRVVQKKKLYDNRNLPGIHLYIDRRSGLPSEGYRLSIDPGKIVITGADYGGLFNGIQTLMQLFPGGEGKNATQQGGKIFPKENNNTPLVLITMELPCLLIEDYPRFGYRGMHLDVARTFSTKEDVMRYIDNMSRYKINKFHWHLTDDEGWRIEIKAYPKLTGTGAFRGGDSPVMPIYGKWNERYGGYYTQDEIREVVEYAAVRNVEIIPEIDLPGHSRAAALSYPELLCATPPDTLSSGGYDRRNVWCVSREENYEMLDSIFSEIMRLFPSEYIHIGGDEVEFEQWSGCPHCQELATKEGLKDGRQLQYHFMKRLEGIIARHGRMSAVWNEAINGGELPATVRVHGWENVKVCREAASKGYSTVVMPGSSFYFDMKYAKGEPGMQWAGIVPTEKVYSFDFEKQGFTAEQMKNVIGVSGAFWAELYLSNGDGYLDRQVWPRICALSEVAWSADEAKNRDDFFARLDNHYPRLEALGIKYRREPSVPAGQPVAKKLITPPVKVTGSVGAWTNNPYSRLEDYNFGSHARTLKTLGYGDNITFTFAGPVECEQIELVTGYSYLPRCILMSGYVELLYAGDKEFQHYGTFKDGALTISPDKAVKALRIVSTQRTNGEKSVIIQPLRIVAK